MALDPHFEYGDYQTDSVQCPAQIRKEENDGLHPRHIKEFHAHVAHRRKEVAKEAHELAVDPVDVLIHQSTKEIV